MPFDRSGVADASTLIRHRVTTWGYLLGLPPPWPAACDRCHSDLGEHIYADDLTAVVAAHLRTCSWWRNTLRAVSRRLCIGGDYR